MNILEHHAGVACHSDKQNISRKAEAKGIEGFPLAEGLQGPTAARSLRSQIWAIMYGWKQYNMMTSETVCYITQYVTRSEFDIENKECSNIREGLSDDHY